MSADATPDEHTITDLRRMDESEARQSLTVTEYERWEAVNDRLDEHAEALDEWDDTRQEATDIMLRADTADLAESVTVFGNPLSVYYAPDDPRIREQADRLGDAFGVDIEDAGDDPDVADGLSTDDLDDEVIDDVKDILADLLSVAIVEWDGTKWGDLSDADREAIHGLMTADPPEGWGVAGLMDAWVEVAVAVENNRDERLERIQKFRDAGRRGDR